MSDEVVAVNLSIDVNRREVHRLLGYGRSGQPSKNVAKRLDELWPEALIVTPGIRPAGSSMDDQQRAATPGGAILAGADYLVVGRPIRMAEEPVETADAIAREVEEALNKLKTQEEGGA